MFRSWFGKTHRNPERRRKHLSSQPEALESRTLLTVNLLTTADPSLYGDTSNNASGIPSISASGNIVAFRSFGANLLPNVEVQGQVYVYNRVDDSLSLVTQKQSGGGPSSIGGINPVVSPDGRYVLYFSSATDLVSQNAGQLPFHDQVYLRDLQTNSTSLISVTPDGNAAGNGDSGGVDSGQIDVMSPSLYAFSGNARFVVFWSRATNLVSPAPVNPNQLYVRDLVTQTTRLVSLGSDGNPANPTAGFEQLPYQSLSVSDDGRYVSFTTNSNGLVPGDSNNSMDVFVRDLIANTTRLVSAKLGENVPGNGTLDVNGNLAAAVLTRDGTRVYFLNSSTDLVAGATISGQQLFVRDLTSNTTSLVSHAAGNPLLGCDSSIHDFSISGDGRFVTFHSDASNLLPEETEFIDNVFLRDMSEQTTTLVSHAPNGEGGDGYSFTPTISDDGSTIVFGSFASNLISNFADNNGSSPDYFVFRRTDGSVRLLTADKDNPAIGGTSREAFLLEDRYAVLNADGSAIAFQNLSSNLVNNDNNQTLDVFIQTLAGTSAISRRDDSLPAAYSVGGSALGSSADGRFILLGTEVGSELLLGGGAALYLRDTLNGTTTKIPNSESGNDPLARITSDGRFVVFRNDQLYLYDRQSNTTEVISTLPGGGPSTFDFSFVDSDVSGNGRYVVFSGNPGDLINGFIDGNVGSPNGGTDLYLRDRQTGTTVLVNRKQGTTATSSNSGILNFIQSSVQVSADGRKVFFETKASDLTSNDSNSDQDVYAFDIATETLTLVSIGLSGMAVGVTGNFAASADGRYVSFVSSGNLVSGVTGTHVYVRDLQTGTTRLVDVNASGNGAGNNGAELPHITPDGRYVLFQSSADDLTLGMPSSSSDNIFVRDLVNNQTFLVSAAPDGVSGGDRSSRLNIFNLRGRQQISPNGRYVAFESFATNLITGFVDGNPANRADLYLRDLQTGVTRLISENRTATASGNFATTTIEGPCIVLDDGRVVFSSLASNLSSTLDSNAIADAFLANPLAISGGTVSGTVFDDLDGDGTRDAGENGIFNAVLYLDANANGSREANEAIVRTAANGTFSFLGVSVGTHQLRQEISSDTQISAPAAGFYTIQVTSDGQTINERDFGNRVLRPDLVVDNVQLVNATTLQPMIELTWTVTNRGQFATDTNGWQDAVYLSATQTLGPAAVLLTTVNRNGDLSINGSYQGHAIVNTSVFEDPMVPYFVIIQTDRRQLVAESLEGNNSTPTSTLTVDIPELQLGTPIQSAFAGLNSFHFFQVTVDPGQFFRLLLNSEATVGGTEILVRREAVPTLWEFDFRAAVPAEPDQSLVVPDLEGGTYYVLVRSGTVPVNASQNFSISAVPVNFEITSVDRNLGDRGGSITLTIDGARFAPDMRADLINSAGGTFAATRFQLVDATRAIVTFDLTQVPEGTYGILLSLDQINVTVDPTAELGVHLVSETITTALPNALTVVAARPDDVQIVVSATAIARASQSFEIIVEAINHSTHDVAAPVIVLSTDSFVRLRTTRDAYHSQLGALTVLAISNASPAGIIRAGQSGFALVRGQRSTPGEITLTASLAFDDGSSVDYTGVLEDLDLDPASPSGTLVLAALRQQFGNSWTTYLSGLAAQATKLSEFGRYVDSAQRLLLEAGLETLSQAAPSVFAPSSESASEDDEPSGHDHHGDDEHVHLVESAPPRSDTFHSHAESTTTGRNLETASAAVDEHCANLTDVQLQEMEGGLRVLAEEMRALAGEDSQAAANLDRFLGPDGNNEGYTVGEDNTVTYGPDSPLSAQVASNLLTSKSFLGLHLGKIVPIVKELLEAAAQSGSDPSVFEGQSFSIAQDELPSFYALPDPIKLVFPFGASFDLGATFGNLRTGKYTLTHVMLPEREMCDESKKDYRVQIDYEFTDGYDFQFGSDTSGPILGPINLSALCLAERGFATPFKTKLQISLGLTGSVELPPSDPSSPDCHNDSNPPSKPGPITRITIVGSLDPNDIAGPAGFATPRFLTPDKTFPYLIHFENDPNLATAPAQEVFVTQQLDADLDWSTFELGDVGFGSLIVNMGTGLQTYQSRVSYSNQDGSPLFVDVSAGLDLQTGIVTWTFRSVDPDTGVLPQGVFDGFLPVNDATSRGEGFISYRIHPKTNLNSGTTIDALASIVFDLNAPLATNVFTNTIDVDLPVSNVTPLPATTGTATFGVAWTGSDNAGGSGIASYDIFVSDNNGPFTLWLNDTIQTSGNFAGQNQHTYRFYAIATDNVGLSESAVQLTEATTTVNEVPPLSINGPAVTWIKKQQPVTILPLLTVGNASLGGGTLTISVNVIGTKKKALDQFTFPATAALGASLGPQYANSRVTLQIQLTPTVTSNVIQNFLRGIRFSTKGKGLSSPNRTFQVTLANSNGLSSTVNQTINVRKKA